MILSAWVGRISAFYILYFHIFYFTEQVGSKYEIIQQFVAGSEDVVFCAFPFFPSFVDINDLFSDSHHGVHVMRVDDCRHVVFPGDVVYKIIDH